ncbi:hypothetical protein HUO13_13200 [Saccharopolyspora erythraea]|uniref:hypothetical protein n=1 Tax=Saccharopolyspora erythraea TaxID=1836 RepID=UPI001BA569E6|nr:hypothetical protein [Saccharopolyspora erythraea]QUH01644.1 hypothetical protein HUO13_13200 [Saccharopolyspora erythraea]
MRRVRGWLGGAAALACAAMAVTLYLSDLETLSWVAGAGSFVTAVSSLVLTLALARVPASRPAPPEPGSTDDDSLPVVLDLTTTAMRIGARAAGALKGVLWSLGFFVAILLVVWLFGEETPAQQWAAEIQKSAEEFLLLMLLFTAVFALEGDLGGRDTLIVDTGGLTVVDRRWLRWKDRSFSLSWDELETVRVAAAPNGSSYTLVGRLSGNDRAKRAAEHDLAEARGGHVIAALRLGTDIAKRAGLLSALRSALERFAGDRYRR